MSSYKDLTDNVDESFTFGLSGKKYEMRYPTTRELEEIQTLNEKYSSLESESDEAKELNQKLNDALYQFIKPVGHETDFKEALKDSNVQVLKNFNTMIKTELSV